MTQCLCGIFCLCTTGGVKRNVRITLVRHGRPEVVNRYSPFQMASGADCGSLIDEYAKSGIDRSCAPPKRLVDVAGKARAAFASSLSRAVESAHMLGLSGRLTVDPLFDEAGIPHGYLPAWRLPAALWMGISRGAWFFGFSPNCENIGTLKQRAAKAAAVLHLQALDSQSVILVGHGCINAFIWRELRLLGWRPEGFYRNRHWAANSLGRS